MMKKMIFLFVLISLSACSNNELPKVDEGQLPVTIEDLEGNWLAVESHEISTSSDPISFQPIEEENRYIYKFYYNYTVTAIDLDPEITHQGNFIIIENQLELDFGNEGEILVLYVMSITENQLIVRREFGIEGIIIKFKRQNQ